jgi:transcription-repair coupling factor (superfamily II helicase)
VDDNTPKLAQLGTVDWARTREKARQAAQEVASELLALYAQRELQPGFAYPPDNAWQHELEAAFPFQETPDQLQAIIAVKVDLERARPMDRLVCGDVGYGKTEVALRAAFKVLQAGKQVAVLAPTTVLAQQHYETFQQRLAAFPVRVTLLSRLRNTYEQKETLQALAKGAIDVVVGTHRLALRGCALP